MSEKKTMDDEKLEDVSGGYRFETKEVADFINAHGGHVRYDDNMAKDCLEWFRENDRWKMVGLCEADFTMNYYQANSVRTIERCNVNHEDFMKMLHEAFD